MKLNELHENPGAAKKRKRIGRGPGSGTGKTGGRGIKGQKSRSGVAIKGFEGGQMPIHMRMPKRGFNKPNRLQFAVVNLGNIQAFIDSGKLDAKSPIDEATLLNAGVVRRIRDGVRILGKGELTAKGLNITVTGASKSAVDAVAAAGGTLTVTKPAAPAADAADA